MPAGIGRDLSFPPALAIAVMAIRTASNECGVAGFGCAAPRFLIIRGSVLSLKEKEFVEAAVAMGVGKGGILVRHIFTQLLDPLIAQMTHAMAYAILMTHSVFRRWAHFNTVWGNILSDAVIL